MDTKGECRRHVVFPYFIETVAKFAVFPLNRGTGTQQYRDFKFAQEYLTWAALYFDILTPKRARSYCTVVYGFVDYNIYAIRNTDCTSLCLQLV